MGCGSVSRGRQSRPLFHIGLELVDAALQDARFVGRIFQVIDEAHFCQRVEPVHFPSDVTGSNGKGIFGELLQCLGESVELPGVAFDFVLGGHGLQLLCFQLGHIAAESAENVFTTHGDYFIRNFRRLHMTKIEGKTVVRETAVLDGGRPIVVELQAEAMKLFLKGRPKAFVVVGYQMILDLGRKMAEHRR